jgi:hypothetical protein
MHQPVGYCLVKMVLYGQPHDSSRCKVLNKGPDGDFFAE